MTIRVQFLGRGGRQVLREGNGEALGCGSHAAKLMGFCEKEMLVATAWATPTAPAIDEKMVATARAVGTTTEDRRGAKRLARCLRATLVGYRDANDVAAETRDISEGGAYLLAPCDCGVSVGQRYEIVFAAGVESAAREEHGYATVIRTERVRRDDRDVAVGVGLRFDQPLYL